MLSEQNNSIHPGNYEEFFILYMDKELNHAQMKAVDEFLLAHPGLQPEFEMLMNTQLPMEEFSFDKEELQAHKMKLASVDEELLLYIDNELPLDKKRIVEEALASDKDYQLQHRVLLQTKSDPAEQIVYPDKKELYRHAKKIIAFKPWMRIAAAIIIIAMAGLLYFKNTSVQINKPTLANNVKKADTQQSSHTKAVTDVSIRKEEPLVNAASARKKNHSLPSENKEKKNRILQKNNNEVALNATRSEENILPVKRVSAVDFNNGKMLANNKPLVSVNHFDVTSSIISRTTEEPFIDKEKSIASNDRKGSFRGFLRKATRMIEKRTGIDPANDNGELLIGAVAVNLK